MELILTVDTDVDRTDGGATADRVGDELVDRRSAHLGDERRADEVLTFLDAS